MNIERLCMCVCGVVKETGIFLREELSKIKQSDILVKGHNDFVTYVDKTAEKKLVNAFLKLIPESGFIAEENTLLKTGEHYNWIIDPLDGTTNFIHSLPCFSISVALMRDQQIILGVVYEINKDECFYAHEKGPAFLNGTIINVSEISTLKDSLIATGFPYNNFDRLNQYLKVFNYCLKNTHGIRRLGSAAVDLAYVACGRFEVFYEYGLKPWDVAAGAFIVEKAGGKVFDFLGGNHYVFGQEIIAGNQKVSIEMLNLTKENFG